MVGLGMTGACILGNGKPYLLTLKWCHSWTDQTSFDRTTPSNLWHLVWFLKH